MTYTFKNITKDKINSGINAIRQAGGEINSKEFSISGVEGEYSYDNSTLTVNITDKPWLASWDMIESKLNKFFN